MKLIKKEKDGTFKQTDKAITSGYDHTGMILQARRSFNKTMIENALSTINTVPIEKRNVSGITMGLSKAGYDVMLSELAAFKERLITIANNDSDLSGVYQFNFQLFPVSEDVKDGKKENKE